MLYLFSALSMPSQRVSAWGRMDIPIFSHASSHPWRLFRSWYPFEDPPFVFLPKLISKRFKVIDSSRRGISSSSRSPSDVVLRPSGSGEIQQLQVLVSVRTLPWDASCSPCNLPHTACKVHEGLLVQVRVEGVGTDIRRCGFQLVEGAFDTCRGFLSSI